MGRWLVPWMMTLTVWSWAGEPAAAAPAARSAWSDVEFDAGVISMLDASAAVRAAADRAVEFDAGVLSMVPGPA